MTAEAQRPQRLVRAPSAPSVRVVDFDAPVVAPIESIAADLVGAPRYLLPLITLGVLVVGLVAVLIAT